MKLLTVCCLASLALFAQEANKNIYSLHLF